MTRLSKRMRITTMTGISASLVLVGCWATNMPVQRSTPITTANLTPSSSTTKEEFLYADGVYTATGQYGSLPSSITVSIAVVNDLITDVEVTPHATNPTSLDLQQRFAEAVPLVVIGKPIDEVNVGRLAGSSGTPNGFNAAIQQIKQQAQLEQTQ